VPTIATNVGGTEEIFPKDSHSALLIPPDDPTAIADGIREILNSATLRNRLASSARSRAVQQFNISSAADSLLDHYRAAANG